MITGRFFVGLGRRSMVMQKQITRENFRTRKSFQCILSPAQAIFWCSFTPTPSLCNSIFHKEGVLMGQDFLVYKMLFFVLVHRQTQFGIPHCTFPLLRLKFYAPLSAGAPSLASTHILHSFPCLLGSIWVWLLQGVCRIRTVIFPATSQISTLFTLFHCISWAHCAYHNAKLFKQTLAYFCKITL